MRSISLSIPNLENEENTRLTAKFNILAQSSSVFSRTSKKKIQILCVDEKNVKDYEP